MTAICLRHCKHIKLVYANFSKNLKMFFVFFSDSFLPSASDQNFEECVAGKRKSQLPPVLHHLLQIRVTKKILRGTRNLPAKPKPKQSQPLLHHHLNSWRCCCSGKANQRCQQEECSTTRGSRCSICCSRTCENFPQIWSKWIEGSCIGCFSSRGGRKYFF